MSTTYAADSSARSTERILRRYVLWKARVETSSMPPDLKADITTLMDRERLALYASLPIRRKRDTALVVMRALLLVGVALFGLSTLLAIVVDAVFGNSFSVEQATAWAHFHEGTLLLGLVSMFASIALGVCVACSRSAAEMAEAEARRRDEEERDWLMSRGGESV